MTIPQDIEGLVGSWIFNSDNYVDDGFTDLSGYGNPFLLMQGAVAYDTRGGVEGLLLDNTNLFAVNNPISYQGSIMLVFQDCIFANNTRYVAAFENFDITTTRTTQPTYEIARFEGSGNHRLFMGTPADLTTVPLSEGTGGVSHATVMSLDMSRAQISGRNDDGSDIDNSTTTIVGTASRGRNIVIGRIDLAEDSARIAVTGINKLWLQEMHCWNVNVLKDHNDLITALMAQVLL